MVTIKISVVKLQLGSAVVPSNRALTCASVSMHSLALPIDVLPNPRPTDQTVSYL